MFARCSLCCSLWKPGLGSCSNVVPILLDTSAPARLVFWYNIGTTGDVMDRVYTASFSQSQGREGWSVIFRHPVRADRATGRPGLRVRRGLGTKDRAEAELLVGEMNEILQDPSLWVASARQSAAYRFHQRVVEIFYHDLAPEALDSFAIRD